MPKEANRLHSYQNIRRMEKSRREESSNQTKIFIFVITQVILNQELYSFSKFSVEFYHPLPLILDSLLGKRLYDHTNPQFTSHRHLASRQSSLWTATLSFGTNLDHSKERLILCLSTQNSSFKQGTRIVTNCLIHKSSLSSSTYL